MFFEDLNLHKEDRKYIMIIFILSALCFIKFTEFAMSGGILHPDSALYLLNSLRHAGMDPYHVSRPEDIYLSPIITFLTAMLFKLGLYNKIAIVIVTMTISFAGYFGLYVLFKNRFNSLLSFLGVVIFGCNSLVIFNMPQGLIDIPSVAISVWALVFAIAAIDKNPKYFLISFPLLVIGFFTKYTVGFMLPIMFLYYVMKRNFIGNVDCLISNPHEAKEIMINYLKSREFKYILISAFISILLALIIIKTLILDFGGSLTFLSQSYDTFNGHEYQKRSVYIPDRAHYFHQFPISFSQNRQFGLEFTYLLYFIFGAGLLIYLINAFKNWDVIKAGKESFKTKYFNILLIIIFILCLGTSAVGFKVLSNHMISNISLLVGVTALYALLQRYDIHENNVSLDLMMACYFLIYFIFLSLYAIKVRRYAMPFLPPFIYMVIWGLNSIMKLIDGGFDSAKTFASNLLGTDNNKKFSKVANALPIIMILVLLVSTTIFLAPQEIERDNTDFIVIHDKGFVNDLQNVCDYVKENIPDYHNGTFASANHSHRVIRWYLNENQYYINDDDPNKADFNKSTYIILNHTYSFNNYHEIYNSGDYTLYAHN